MALSSVTNALRVLDHLTEAGEGGVTEVARALDLNPGTTYRMLATLREAEYVEQDPESKKYRPGRKLLRIAIRMRDRVEFLDLVHQHSEQLVARGHETVNFGILRDREVVYLDRVLSKQPLAVEVKIGAHVPAYCTALGKAILAFADELTREDYLDWMSTAPPHPEYAKPDVTDFRVELEVVRSTGHAEDQAEFSPEIACFAAPVLNSQGHAVAALSASGPVQRMNAQRGTLIPMVEIAARELTLLLRELGEDNPRW